MVTPTVILPAVNQGITNKTKERLRCLTDPRCQPFRVGAPAIDRVLSGEEKNCKKGKKRG